MTTCLITGGAGFIGSHLVEACLEKGFHTLVLDDLSTGKRENLPLDRSYLEFIEGDVRNRNLIENIRTSYPDVAYIFHLAAVASVAKSMEDPVNTHEINYMGTLLLLDVFRKSNLRKFVYASSAAVYGDTPTMPLREDFFPRPQSPYGADKLAGEYILKVFNDSYGVPTVSCRFFNVFGERQDPSSPYSGVISIFLDRAVSKKKGENSGIVIFGDGEQTRDFIYVKDVASALLFLAEQETVRGEIFNIGYGGMTTILNLARKIGGLLEVDMDIQYDETREGDIRHSTADIRKLKSTGFRLHFDFDKGLRRLTQWIAYGEGLALGESAKPTGII